MTLGRVLRALGGTLLLASIPIACHDFASASSSQAAGLFGRNLIVNGNAEVGPGVMDDSSFIMPTGWKAPRMLGVRGLTAIAYAAGQDLTASTPGPADRGKNYFYGGPSNGKNTGAEQRINLSGAATAIDGGKVLFTLSGWLGGYSSQQDFATLRATFLNAAGKKIGTASIGPVTTAQRNNATTLLARHAAKPVPTGARAIVLDLLMTWHDGSDNDGLADNLSLVLTKRS